jgi:hypothetical protein
MLSFYVVRALELDAARLRETEQRNWAREVRRASARAHRPETGGEPQRSVRTR